MTVACRPPHHSTIGQRIIPIGAAPFLSANTVKTHISRVFAKT
jgi:DNA-binding NarL/FixJ family response regulator